MRACNRGRERRAASSTSFQGGGCQSDPFLPWCLPRGWRSPSKSVIVILFEFIIIIYFYFFHFEKKRKKKKQKRTAQHERYSSLRSLKRSCACSINFFAINPLKDTFSHFFVSWHSLNWKLLVLKEKKEKKKITTYSNWKKRKEKEKLTWSSCRWASCWSLQQDRCWASRKALRLWDSLTRA